MMMTCFDVVTAAAAAAAVVVVQLANSHRSIHVDVAQHHPEARRDASTQS
jgi:hypothetical protein